MVAMIRALPIILLGLLAPDLVVADDQEGEEDSRKANECIAIKSYNRMFYQAMTDYFMFVRSGNDEYLLTFKRRCPNISDGYNIQFDTRSRRACSNNRPKIAYLYRNMEMPSCRTETIQKVMNFAEAHAIAMEKDRARRAAEAEKRKERRERKKAKQKS